MNVCLVVFLVVAWVTVVHMRGDFLLFTDKKRQQIYRMPLTSEIVSSIEITDKQTPLAIDFDPVRKRIYWTDTGLHQIRSIKLDGTDEQLVRQLPENSIPSGIAVDPYYRLLFYADQGNNAIVVLNMDGTYEKTIINSEDDLIKPRDVVLDPTSAKMYWSNRKSQSSKIERANYDGSDIKSVFETESQKPLGLALDIAGGKIYWNTYKRVYGGNMNGTGKYEIISPALSRDVVDIAISSTTLYYTDKKNSRRIKSVNVNEVNDEVELGQEWFPELGGIYVHQDRLQLGVSDGDGDGVEISSVPDCDGDDIEVIPVPVPGTDGDNTDATSSDHDSLGSDDNTNCGGRGGGGRTRGQRNPCLGKRRGGCSHFCLPMGENTYKCACPTGFVLEDDLKNCVSDE